MTPPRPFRIARRPLLLAAGPALILSALPVRHVVAQDRTAEKGLPPTPEQTAGPFYPGTAKLAGADNDLVRVAPDDPPAQGTPVSLTGRVLDRDGRPVADALVEIWQCDAGGTYHHPRDDGTPDPSFQGFGRTVTDADGGFRFRTIRPVPYGGRTPHIHMRIVAPGRDALTTQIYDSANEDRNARDFIYRRLGPAASAVTVAFRPSASAPELDATLDIVLA